MGLDMESTIKPDAIYTHSEDVVSREIQGVLVLVPVTSGIGDLEEELFSLEDTAKAIWDKLDGHRTVGEIVDELSTEYDALGGEIVTDVVGLLQELIVRKLVVAV